MEEYKVIGWPRIQEFMDLPDFEEHSTLIEPNEKMGIDCNTYLLDKMWYYTHR